MESRDVVDGNVAKIAALFPQCVTERLNKGGKPELAIDFDKLRAEIAPDIIQEGEERYQFTWPDKRAASRLANEPTTMTLRPCREICREGKKIIRGNRMGSRGYIILSIREGYHLERVLVSVSRSSESLNFPFR